MSTSKLSSDDLLNAENTLSVLAKEMTAEYQEGGKKWPLDWMRKHTHDREILIMAMAIILDRADVASNPDIPN